MAALYTLTDLVEIGVAWDEGAADQMLIAAINVAATCRMLEAQGAEVVVPLQCREGFGGDGTNRWGFYAAYRNPNPSKSLIVSPVILRDTLGAVKNLP